ncbi:MAG: sigma-54 dependent transcriptional regulator [Gemmatimonadota bacterium]|nr:sigma-54 dependent transcriptional regulator [Gemmatimonadota bacterium]MDH4348620.1 sigma-54 dependent transcriptional regulator [Gemmatimonadota bacterium]MDH5284061.1 sigma-54 dependent transcriptional regulator [Gemmatimonadota bacterium]
MGSRVFVIAFSDSFGGLWGDLASDLGVPVDIVPADKYSPPSHETAAVILAAGGEERQALQWLEDRSQRLGFRTLVVGADPGRRIAMQMVAQGARDYFVLPDDLELLRNAVAAAVKTPRATGGSGSAGPNGSHAFDGIIGESPALKRELSRAARLVPHRNARVLILGETGTGKEVLARAIHAGGPRREAPFVPVNCSALPENLIESELFGHERGSFTDAHAAKPGLFEIADTGTLFLDEIGELPLGLQAKLLRVLDDRQIRRVGGTKTKAVDVRILAATNEDLSRRVREGTFREDLYFRLSSVVVTLPPLRERDDDMILIAQRLLECLAVEHEVPVPELTAEVKRKLRGHPWPGNVRELKNAVERALLLSPPGELQVEELPSSAQSQAQNGAPFNFPAPLDEITSAVAHATVKWFGGNRSEAARQLGISTKRLRRMLNGAGAEEELEADEEEVAPTPG